MLHNRFAGDALKKVQTLYEGGITMNGQIVLCKGINDGEELERSIRDMTAYLPHLQSVSVVPVGLTVGAIYKRRGEGSACNHSPLAEENL